MHHGQKLAELIKSKGLKFTEVASALNVTKQTLNHDTHKEQLSRVALKKYLDLLEISFTDFYEDQPLRFGHSDSVDKDQLIDLQRQLIAELRERLKDKDLLLSFTKAGNTLRVAA